MLFSLAISFLTWLVWWVAENCVILGQTKMWATAQRDGRPAEYTWRPQLFNAAKFAWRPLLDAVQ